MSIFPNLCVLLVTVTAFGADSPLPTPVFRDESPVVVTPSPRDPTVGNQSLWNVVGGDTTQAQVTSPNKTVNLVSVKSSPLPKIGMIGLVIGPRARCALILIDNQRLLVRTGASLNDQSGRSWSVVEMDENGLSLRSATDTIHATLGTAP